MKFSYRTSGEVCSDAVHVDIEHGRIAEVRFDGGCPGSLAAVSKLVVGMTPQQAIDILSGTRCGGKSTSCPDQLARALREYLKSDRADGKPTSSIHMLYGALGGDIIGSRFEWHNLKSKDFELFDHHSQFTDDTVLTVATADALLHNIGYDQAYRRWGNRYPHAGYGGKFRHWLAADEPRPYNSWGNGSAMRVSPVGFFMNTVDEVLAEAERSAAVTHNHPEGIKGAQAAALAVFLAKNGSPKAEIKAEIEKRFDYDLSSKTLDQIRPDYFFDVSCLGTLPVALLAFLESENYEDAIRNAISVGGDSDTIAAITGGIALAFYKTMNRETARGIRARLPEEIKVICREFGDI